MDHADPRSMDRSAECTCASEQIPVNNASDEESGTISADGCSSIKAIRPIYLSILAMGAIAALLLFTAKMPFSSVSGPAPKASQDRGIMDLFLDSEEVGQQRNHSYQIVWNKHPDLCLSVEPSTNNAQTGGQRLQLWNCNERSDFFILPAQNQGRLVWEENQALCLHSPYGIQVEMWECGQGVAETYLWKINKTGTAVIERAVEATLCLYPQVDTGGVPQAETQANSTSADYKGAYLQLWECSSEYKAEEMLWHTGEHHEALKTTVTTTKASQNMDCEFMSWGAWSDCTAEAECKWGDCCRFRTRGIFPGLVYSRMCIGRESRSEACDPQSCLAR